MTHDNNIVFAPLQTNDALCDTFYQKINHEKTNPNSLNELLSTHLKTIETIIQEQFQLEKLPILEPLSHYIIHSGGKRIRPLLCVAIAELAGDVNHNTLMTAAAIEFIHTATLLHDDVVDNGDARRGKKTAHLIWGNQAAILVGDHMFARAFAMLAETENIRVIQTLSSAAKMLAEGEIIQLSLKQKIPTFQDHLNIIKNKTAALFAAGCACGVILNNGTDAMIQNAYNFGFNFGISFQLIDDILDYQGDDNLGKTIGADFFEGKFTLPLIFAYNQATDTDKEFIKSVMHKKTERNNHDFQHTKAIIENLDVINQARKFAMDYIKIAEKNLEGLNKNNFIQQTLMNFIQQNLYRHL